METLNFNIGSRVARDHRLASYKTGTIIELFNSKMGFASAKIKWDHCSIIDGNHLEFLHLMNE